MNKSEIAAKLKSSIEEKLYSLGAYVDKELPEYILVMIANKKNKESMEKDLQLFLGQDTSSFIDWLHDLLGKFQENVESTFRSSKEKTVESSKHSGRHSPEKKKKKEKSRGKKERRSDEKKNSIKSNALRSHRSRSRSPTTNKSKESPKKNAELFKVTKHCSPKEQTKTKGTPDKSIKKIISPSKIDSSTTMDEGVTEAPVLKVSSVVKIADRCAEMEDNSKYSKQRIEKEGNQRHISSRSDTDQRTSVFCRLGKLSKRDAPEQRETKTDIIHHKENDVPKKQPIIDKSMDNDGQRLNRNSKRTLNKEEFNDFIYDEVIDLDKPDHFSEDSNAWFSKSKVPKLNEEKLSNTNFIVTLKGVDRLNLSVKSRLGPKRNMDDVPSTADEIMTEIEEEVKEDIVQEVVEDPIKAVIVTDGQLSKCKFWPSCKNNETCPYFHPQDPCKNFPNCKFGISCLFVHPNCRFEPNCTKHDCAFSHSQPRQPTIQKHHGLPSSFGRCVYYPKCTNVNCKYFHPNIACKYGLACKAKDTCMFYHPSLPHITELKWVAPNDQDNQATKMNAPNSLTEVPSA